MRVLFLSPYVPSRIRVRPYQWLRALSSLGHELHLVALQPPEDAWASTEDVARLCATVTLFPLSRARTVANALRAVFTSSPLQVAYSRLPAAERAVADLARRHHVDVVHIEHMRGAVMASGVSALPRVFDAVDSISKLFESAVVEAPSRGQRLTARLDLARTRAFEGSVTTSFERVVVTSALDADVFAGLGADRTRIAAIANGVDTEYFANAWQPVSPPCVVFSGKMSYHANEAAARRLVERIMPRVWQQRPDVEVVLAGKDPPSGLQALASDRRVSVTGYVEDLRPWLCHASVAVSPLVYGAGIQNKVLEAMSSGVPTVASPQAVSALTADVGRDVLVADSDAAFADAITSVLDDRALASALGSRARAYVERCHDWRTQAGRLVDVYGSAVAAHRGGGPR
jgi:glycosyltransferase involved in cell wall biosynthesis